MKVKNVLETCLYTDNLEKMASFYREILGLRLLSYKENSYAFFRLDNTMLLVFDRNYAKSQRSVPPHEGTGRLHICFSISDKDTDIWKRYLKNRNVEYEIHYWKHANSESIYLYDPEGNVVELASPVIWKLEVS